MYTQCPHCQTCFRIAEDHLKIANGKVRCGSCQEVFDATRYLFKNLTDREPITFTPAKPAARPEPPATPPPSSPSAGTAARPEPDRSPTPPPQPAEKLLQEREKAPDQSPFMESTIGNDRYNNLDSMDAVDIPGQIDLGDSTINLPDEEDSSADNQTPTSTDAATPAEADPDKTAASSPPQATQRTIYEDIESKEAPVTDAEQETLKNFFAEVDAQLDDAADKSQLDKDIDELLAFANGLDQDKQDSKSEPADEPSSPNSDAQADTSGVEAGDAFDMQAIADFEKELEASNPDVFNPVSENAQAEAELDEALSPPEGEALAEHEDPHADADTEQLADETDSTEAEVTPAAVEAHEEKDDEVPRALRHSLQMLNQGKRRSPGKTLLMLLLILLLIGGLGFQVVLFRNVELAHKFPSLIPELSQICARIPCRYSGKVDVSQIKLLNRDVRSDPNQPNALLISATFVDKAPFDQPYPIIKITLYDLGGNVVASRRFTPKEYLQKMYNRFLLMESGTPVHITLAVLDPGKDAINFEFTFL